ncbi:MAG: hypothetical protein GX443_13280 [Deltaproteobacteria bacterium]|nr:hypothetical protein [Deltaproteobacteria bacterium]
MKPGKRVDMAVLGAVPFEVEALCHLLEEPHSVLLTGQTLWVGSYGKLQLLVGTTGLGKVNAAAVTSVLLQRFSVGRMWNTGSAGAYEESPLRVGDVLMAQRAICGDEGILTTEGIAPTSRMGIPIARRGSEVYYDAIPLYPEENPGAFSASVPPGWYCLEREGRLRKAVLQSTLPQGGRCRLGSIPVECPEMAVSAAGFERPSFSNGVRADFQLVYGPSLTVGMTSGDRQTARGRFHRYGAFAENMEGSAVAQTCLLYGVPVVECRGISNMAGDRRKENWKSELAVAHCQGILLRFLETLSAKIPLNRGRKRIAGQTLPKGEP